MWKSKHLQIVFRLIEYLQRIYVWPIFLYSNIRNYGMKWEICIIPCATYNAFTPVKKKSTHQSSNQINRPWKSPVNIYLKRYLEKDIQGWTMVRDRWNKNCHASCTERVALQYTILPHIIYIHVLYKYIS